MTINKIKLPLIGNSAILGALLAFMMISIASCSNNSSNSGSSSANEADGYGEYSKDLVAEDVEIEGELSECLSVVPGSYKLIYISKEADSKYGRQEFIMKVKLKLEKPYDGEVGWKPKLIFTNQYGVKTSLDLDLSRGPLDYSEKEKFEKFVVSEPGSVKEFMFYDSMGNREYANGLYDEAEGFGLWTSGYEKTEPTSPSSSSSSSTEEDNDDTTTSSATTETSTKQDDSSSDDYQDVADEPEDEDQNSSVSEEESEKIDLDLDEFESYVEQYLEYDNRRSVGAIKALGCAKAYSTKLKVKKKKMSSEQLSRYESIKSRY